MRILKAGVSWLWVAIGLAVSVAMLGLFGMRPVFGYSSSTSARVGTLAIGIFGAAVLYASLAAVRSRKRAALVCLAAAPLPFFFSGTLAYLTFGDRAAIAEPSVAVLVVLGLFWFITYRFHWPDLISQGTMTSRTRFLLVGASGFSLLVLASVAAIAFTIRAPDIGDCAAPPPFAKPKSSEQVVLTARVVHVGNVLGSVSLVQHRYWGLPSYSKLVFLPVSAKPGDTFFIDGQLGMGILTRYLFPVINMHCSRSAPLQEAAVDLRVLREGPPTDGVRVIGQVVRYEPGYERQGIPHVPVTITGPMGSVVTITDQEGIYDLKNVPEGSYSVRTDTENEIMRDSTLVKSMAVLFAYTKVKFGDVRYISATPRTTTEKFPKVGLSR